MFFKKNKKKLSTNKSTPIKKRKRSLITGIVVGGAIGSVLSLLFAPRKGSETRKKVYKTSKDIYNDGKTKAELFLEKYKKKIEDKLKE